MTEDIHDIDVIDQVIYDTVHRYVDASGKNKGAGALGKLIGMNGSTLQHKANRNDMNQQLSVKEARTVMLATQDFQILKELAAELNHAVVLLPVVAFPADMDLVQAITDWTNDYGETAAAIRAAVDKKVEKEKIDLVRKELIEDFEKGIKILDVLEGMAE